MRMQAWRRCMLGAALVGGCLFSGPCGITTVQFSEFVRSALIRTGVTTVAAAVEAAIIEAALDPGGE